MIAFGHKTTCQDFHSGGPGFASCHGLGAKLRGLNAFECCYCHRRDVSSRPSLFSSTVDSEWELSYGCEQAKSTMFIDSKSGVTYFFPQLFGSAKFLKVVDL